MLRRSGILGVALSLALSAAVVGGVVTSAAAVPGGPVVPGTSCPMFPANSIWNTKITRLPVHKKSAVWMASMGSSSRNLHPDYGPAGGGEQPYGIPWTIVSPPQTLVPVAFDYDDESDPGPYPLSASTPIEGGSSPGPGSSGTFRTAATSWSAARSGI